MPASPGMKRFASVTASTKRTPDVDEATGLKSAPADYLYGDTAIKITPLQPISTDITERLQIQNPIHTLHAYNFDDDDIKQGDRLTPSTGEYADEELDVTIVEQWPWRGQHARLIIVEREIAE